MTPLNQISSAEKGHGISTCNMTPLCFHNQNCIHTVQRGVILQIHRVFVSLEQILICIKKGHVTNPISTRGQVTNKTNEI